MEHELKRVKKNLKMQHMVKKNLKQLLNLGRQTKGSQIQSGIGIKVPGFVVGGPSEHQFEPGGHEIHTSRRLGEASRSF